MRPPPTPDAAFKLPDLEWEGWVFRGLVALWRRLRPPPAVTTRPEAAAFEADLRMWTVFAQVLAAEPVRLLPASEAGGLRQQDLLVPPSLDLGGDADSNRDVLRLRLLVHATIRRLGLDRAPGFDPSQGASSQPGDTGHRALASLTAARRATESLLDGLPAIAALHARVASAELGVRPPGAPEWDTLRARCLDLSQPWVPPAAPPAGDPGPPLQMWGQLVPRAAPTGATAAGAEPESPTITTERRGRAIDEVEQVILDEEHAREKVIQHNFEKVETLDEHRGQEQRTDGSDDLDDHAEALEELDLRQVIRGGERAQSMLRAPVGIDADVPDVQEIRGDEAGVNYDEWDVSRRAYRPAWCTVYPTAMGPGEPTWGAEALRRHHHLIDELERRLTRFRSRRSPIRAQRDGDELDLDALVDDFGDRHAGREPSDRLYQRKLRSRRSVATTVLIDVSLSSDAWIAERRVLDVAREAVLVLGEVAARLGDPLQILAFASHTRNRCRVWEVQGWRESAPRGRARLGVLRPQGYTRIGPALRHSIAGLSMIAADRRLLLLVSDGKPTDYDRYEGRYGVADVRQAIREGEARGVVTHALAVDALARDHLPAMTGPGAWHILPDPRRLPEVLTTVYGRLTGG